MNNRKQKVDLEFIKNTLLLFGSGNCSVWCSQGSVLGLLLYNIYINDFPKIINKLSHTLLFADDTSILVISTDYIELSQKIKLHPA